SHFIGGALVVAAVGDGGGNVVDAAVDDGVRVGVDGDDVVARLQHIGFGVAVVIGSHIFHVELDGDILGRTGFQLSGLGKADQVGGSLFNAAVGVGRVVVDFHNVLAGHGTGVGDGDTHGDDAVSLGHTIELLRERGVAEAVAEGILHHRVIVDEALHSGS